MDGAATSVDRAPQETRFRQLIRRDAQLSPHTLTERGAIRRLIEPDLDFDFFREI
jgi:hypothetical protein